ncbi:hypothetical protein C8R45DRAFT_934709 [Mycena sanguinolenta]|nr:hypothetical protein C8R45DRAFT_934709 [Mycena sanguinolenta]
MNSAQKSLLKYESEFKAEVESEILLSPVSTDPKIYVAFPTDKAQSTQINYLYDNIPSLKKLWRPRYNKDIEGIAQELPIPAYLEGSFPDRPPEIRPSIIYYSAEGERKEISVSSRSSRGLGSNFQLPPEAEAGPSRRSRKAAASQSPESQPAKSHPQMKKDGRGDNPREQKKTTTTEPQGLQTHSRDVGSSAGGNIPDLLSSGTPYKRPEDLLVPKSPHDSMFPTFVLSFGLPNPLSGMASSAPFTFPTPFESMSQSGKGKKKMESSYVAGGRLLNPTIPEESSFHDGDNQSKTSERVLEPLLEADSLIEVDQETRERAIEQPERKELEEGNLATQTRRNLEDVDDDRWRGRNECQRPPPRHRTDSPNQGNRRYPSPPSGPPSDPDDKGSGSSSNSSERSDHRFPYVAPGAPYGTIVPTIEPKLKPESLPEWDGNHDSAVDYFWEDGFCELWDFGCHSAGERFTSLIMVLYSSYSEANGNAPRASSRQLLSQYHSAGSFSPTQQSHYLVYLQVIKDSYLGKKWQLRMNSLYEQQSFRQTGHGKESPQTFLSRRIRYMRMLAVTDDGGPNEVYLVMRRAPISWSTILVLENIKSVEALYEKVNDHEDELVEIVARSYQVGFFLKAAAPKEKPGMESSSECKPATEIVNVKGKLASDNKELIHGKEITGRQRILKVEVEEIEDEYWLQEARMPKARTGILEENVDKVEPESPFDLEEVTEMEVETNRSAYLAETLEDPLPAEVVPIQVRPKRRPRVGDSALGVSVLSIKGWIGSLKEELIDLHLDSCADISLVSEEFLNSLRIRPTIREGRRMTLVQLTDQGTVIKGFCRLKILVMATSGKCWKYFHV